MECGNQCRNGVSCLVQNLRIRLEKRRVEAGCVQEGSEQGSGNERAHVCKYAHHVCPEPSIGRPHSSIIQLCCTSSSLCVYISLMCNVDDSFSFFCILYIMVFVVLD